MEGDLHRWAESRGLNPYHPADWDEIARQEYERDFGWSAPWSDTYRHCPCHPHRFARTLTDDVSDAELQGYIEDDPTIRRRYSRETAKGLAYLNRWSLQFLGSRQARARRRVLDARGRL